MLTSAFCNSLAQTIFWEPSIHISRIKLVRKGAKRTNRCTAYPALRVELAKAAYNFTKNKRWQNYQRFCLFVCLFWFNVAFNNVSVISRQCLVATGGSVLTFIVMPHWSIMPQTLDMMQHPLTLSWHWVDQSKLYPTSLSAKRGTASTIFNDFGMSRPGIEPVDFSDTNIGDLLPPQPGAVARSEASSLGMQAAPSSIPTSGTFFRGDLVMKTFLRPFSLFRWFKKSRCQLLAKECALSTGKLPRRLAQEQCG